MYSQTKIVLCFFDNNSNRFFSGNNVDCFLKGKQRGRSEGLRITWRGDAASLEGNRRKYVRNKTEKRFRSFLNDNQIFDF